MKKSSKRVTRQRRSKKESQFDQLEELSRRVIAEKISLESTAGTERSFGGPPYRKIIE
jgi:hypothetical protein